MKRALAFALVLVATIALWLSPLHRALSWSLLDSHFSWWPVERAQPPIAIVGFDEQTVALLKDPLALWHPHLARFLQAMTEAKPRALALDLVLPDRSYDYLAPGRDQALLQGLAAVREAEIPLRLALVTKSDGTPQPIHPPLLFVAGRDSLVSVALPLDRGDITRWAELQIDFEVGSLATMAAALATDMGATPTSGLINYGLRPFYDYIPMHEVLERSERGDTNWLREQFAAKAVFLGSVDPYEDRHRVPVPLARWEPENTLVPGVLLHAQSLHSHLSGAMLQPVPRWLELALIFLAAGFWFLASRPVAAAAFAALCIGATYAVSVAAYFQGIFLPMLTSAVVVLGCVGLRLTYESASAILVRKRLEGAFGRYVSPHVLRELMSGELSSELGGERKCICILFSDIRGFTARSDGASPEDTISMLNLYLDAMAKVIHRHDGTIDKFMGDGIMAFFGAPNALDSPALAGWKTAVEMLEALESVNESLIREGERPLAIGIGLHIGEAVVGHVGSEERREYTAIGDAVNVASRLEGLTKTVGYPVVISQEMGDEVNDERLVDLGFQSIAGHGDIHVFGYEPGSHKSNSS